MSFTSIFFIFLFLPFFILLYYVLWKFLPKLKNLYLLIISFIFYIWGSPKYFILLVISVLINFILGYLINSSKKLKNKIFVLIIGLGINIIFLGYFKYANFFILEFDKILQILGMSAVYWGKVGLPLAISFYIFNQISYLVDVYRGEKHSRNIIDYFLFVTFFPKMIAGPLTRWNEFYSELKNRKESFSSFFDGIYRFSLGLAMKVVLANTLGEFVDKAFNNNITNIPLLQTWIVMFAYTFQIFFDFAGYTNMAIGLGKMVGFNLPENFNLPYLSKSITEFWRRWHITLGRFLKDYLYIPLGGSRCSKLRNSLNFIIVFSLGGLWHGAGFHFIAWGFYYGFLLAAEKHLYGKYLGKLPSFLQTIITFILIIIGWVFFRAQSLSIALKIIINMFIPKGPLAFYIHIDDRYFLTMLILGILFTLFPLLKNFKFFTRFNDSAMLKGITLFILFFLSIAIVASGSFKAFIYQQF